MVFPDMPGLDQSWEWQGLWKSHCVPNEEIRQKTQSVSGVGAPMISLLNSSSHLSVCFYVESQGAYSTAEPLFHDVDIAARLWSGQVFPPVSSTGIPAGVIGSKGQRIAFFYKTVNIFKTNTQTKQMNERGDKDLAKFWKRVQLTPLRPGTHPCSTDPGEIPLKPERLGQIKRGNVLSCTFEILYDTKMPKKRTTNKFDQ